MKNIIWKITLHFVKKTTTRTMKAMPTCRWWWWAAERYRYKDGEGGQREREETTIYIYIYTHSYRIWKRSLEPNHKNRVYKPNQEPSRHPINRKQSLLEADGVLPEVDTETNKPGGCSRSERLTGGDRTPRRRGKKKRPGAVTTSDETSCGNEDESLVPYSPNAKYYI